MKPNYKKRFLNCLPICLFTSVSFFLLGPVTLYIGNQSEFSFALTDILPYLLLFSGLSFAALMAVCMVIPKGKARSIVTAVILGIGIGFYVQSNFMSGGYGQLNGQEIAWDSMHLRGIINTIVWLVCIIGPVAIALSLKKQRFQWQKVVAGLFLAIQVLSCLLLVITGGNAKDKDSTFTVSTQEAFTLSEEKNVVVFLLDNFSSVLFEEIVTEDSSYSEQFNGFTYFPDTVGIGCTTKGSLPFILTGMWNENSTTYGNYLNLGYNSNALYAELDQLDYDTRLFVDKKYVGSDAAHLFDNMTQEKAVFDKGKITSLMYKFTAFTYMPHYLKPAFWFYTGEFASASQDVNDQIRLSPDPTFYDSLLDHGITVNEDYNGAYRFYYMSGAHKPFNMDENAEAVESGSVTMKQRAKGALKIVSTYLQQLRDLGLYDDTMVMVLADHGDWEDAVVFNPMLFVKPFGSQTEGLAISQAPVSYEDLLPTLLEELTGEDAGTTLFEVAENEQRERRFLYYNWNGDWEADYLPALYEYEITGNIRELTSRRPTGRVFTEDGLIYNSTEYTLGQQVVYNAATASEQNYVYYGMYYPEESYTYTKGDFTQWIFPLAAYDGEDLQLQVEVAQIRGDSQRVLLYVNDQYVSEKYTEGSGTLTFFVPGDLIPDRDVNIRLEFPDASNSEEDDRIRALAIRSITLDKFQPYTLGEILHYNSASEDANPRVVYGMHTADDHSAFTKGHSTLWEFPLEGYVGGDLQFQLDVSQIRDNAQRVKLTVNGQYLQEKTIENSGFLNFFIPESAITGEELQILLDFPDASASEGDPRVRGIAVKSAVLDHPQTYTLGQEILYNVTVAQEDTFVAYGLHAPESGHTFTNGNCTLWEFPLSAYLGGDLQFQLSLAGIHSGSQRVRLTVNDQYLEEVTAADTGSLTLTIPGELICDNTVSIRLDFPDAGCSESDQRVRSLAIKSAVLDYKR